MPLCIFAQLSTKAQHLKSIDDPYTHQRRITSEKVQLRGSFYVWCRSVDSLVFLYMDGWGKSAGIINSHDVALLITPSDTIVARPTGTQAYHETGHGHYTQEYGLSNGDLIKLSREPLVLIRRYYAGGIEDIPIPTENKGALMQLAKELNTELK